MSYLVPTVIEKDGNGERAYDIYSRLMKERIIFLGSAIDMDVANAVVAQMLFLENQSKEQDIIMYINSPGGSTNAGLAILDVMNYIKPDIVTVVVGMAASMGSVLSSSGTKGKRMSLPNSRIMIHQPWAEGIGGQVTDLEITVKEMSRTRDKIADIMAANTGKDRETLIKDMDRDNYMSAQQAMEYGLVDKILEKR